jgi:chorismate-pyruvate lyase
VRPESVHPSGQSLFNPLAAFYERAGRPCPPIEVLKAGDLVDPFKKLLVHSNAMTGTLEAFHGGRLDLRVLSRQQSASSYVRHIVLCRHDTGAPVEFGSIRVDLSAFSQPLRQLILGERAPLGRILEEHRVAHLNRPMAFFRIESDDLLGAVMQIEGRRPLFGRCNHLTDPDGRLLAEIVEIVAS